MQPSEQGKAAQKFNTGRARRSKVWGGRVGDWVKEAVSLPLSHVNARDRKGSDSSVACASCVKEQAELERGDKLQTH